MARKLLERAEVRGKGIILVLGCADQDLVLHLARNSQYLFHVLDPDEAKVESCRQAAFTAGLYGTRIIVERHTYDQLPHADNVCDAVLAPGLAKGSVPEAELLRVLRPRGVAVFKGGETMRASVDSTHHDWSHWRGTPNNGMVSASTLKPPFLLQWFSSEPFFAYAPNIALAASGRLFFVTGDMKYGAIAGGTPRTIYAYNGYNGMLLWKRTLPEGEPIEWPGYVATRNAFYLATEKGCLILDPQTGERLGTLHAKPGDASAWKWIAIDDEGGRLFALLGPQENLSDKMKGLQHYWGAGALTFDKIGDTLVALDLKDDKGKVLWTRRLGEQINGRSLALSHGRIFYRDKGKQVGCIEVASGKTLWTNDDAGVMQLVEAATHAKGSFAPDASGVATEHAYLTTWRRKNVVAFSARDGKVLWHRILDPEGGRYDPVRRILVFPDHILLHAPLPVDMRDERNTAAWVRLDPATGKDLGYLFYNRKGQNVPLKSGSCAVDTASAHTLFQSRRLMCYELQSERMWDMCSVRSTCTTGTVLGNGLAYVTPSFCRCGYALHGVKCFAAAESFAFRREATDAERLVTISESHPQPLPLTPDDWPTYRANNARTASTAAQAPKRGVVKAWEYKLESGGCPSAVTAGGGLVFLGGDDGVVRALDAATGKVRWTFFCGGAVMVPPTLWKGRALFGSADGWVYALSASTGQLLWRFRAAPVERRIGFQSSLASTWPVTTGVLIENSVAYAGAGVLDISGSHLYALDAKSGRILWQHNTARHLDGGKNISMKGILASRQGKLYLPTGISLTVFDLVDGKPTAEIKGGKSSRAADAMILDKVAYTGGRSLLGRGKVFWEVQSQALPSAEAPRSSSLSIQPAANDDMVLLLKRLQRIPVRRIGIVASKPGGSEEEPFWTAPLPDGTSCDTIILAGDVALAVISPGGPDGKTDTGTELLAFSTTDGKQLWRFPLPARVVSDGVIVDRDGRVLVALEDGRVLGLAPEHG